VLAQFSTAELTQILGLLDAWEADQEMKLSQREEKVLNYLLQAYGQA